jgi:hypothetical protein
MKFISLNSICIVLVINVQAGFSQVVNKEVKAKIDIEKVEDVIAVSATAENLKSVFKSISFKLSVEKSNKANTNRSSNVQDGRFTLEPLQKIALSKTEINVTKKDQITISLLIYDENNTLIGQDKIIIGQNVLGDSNVSSKPNDGVGLIGIVSNDTKTKLGNDFYDLFYYQYDKFKLSSPKNISIQEELTFGRTTKISVNVEGEVIDEFIARPDEEFLQYMAESSSSKVFKYFKKLEKQEKSIFQY